MSLSLSNNILSQLKETGDEETQTTVANLASELQLQDLKYHSQRKAAVLIPLILRESSLSVLLTERTHDLPYHAGQISFPGGKIEAQDTSLEMTALRETYEETGLNDITLLTNLGTYTSYSGFEISTFVGLVEDITHLQPNPQEVASTLEVPLDVIMDKSQFTLECVKHAQDKRYFYQLPFEGKNVWGFTGSMLCLFGQYMASLTR